jgi:arsenate reductase
MGIVDLALSMLMNTRASAVGQPVGIRPDQRYAVLFLCTGNSARSIMAEALLNHWGRKRFLAFSAGSHPKGRVHPMALSTLARHGISTEGLRSKSWDEFATLEAPPLDFVFTVCDRAAAEVCPIWPGQPMTAHWGVQDPVAVEGSPEEQQRAFDKAFRELDARLKIFTSLRIEALDQLVLQRQLDAIGKIPEPEKSA